MNMTEKGEEDKRSQQKNLEIMPLDPPSLFLP